MTNVKRKYLILHPNFLGLKEKKGFHYVFRESDNGYILYLSSKDYIGYPKKIVERNPELFKLIRRRK